MDKEIKELIDIIEEELERLDTRSETLRKELWVLKKDERKGSHGTSGAGGVKNWMYEE